MSRCCLSQGMSERGFCRLVLCCFTRVTMSPCGYCLEASTSLRHGRIQQVLSVALPISPVDSRLRGNDGK